MSVDLRKGSKRTPINLKKEEPRKKVNLTKASASSVPAVGTAAGAPASSGTTAPANKEMAKKSGGRKWIAVAAALVLIIGAAAAIRGTQSGRDDAGTTPVETDSGSSSAPKTSTGTGSAPGNETSAAGSGEGAAGTSAEVDSAAGDTAATAGDTAVSGANEGGDDPVSDAASDDPLGSAGAAAGTTETDGKKVGNYELIVSNLSWNEAFNDCLERGGKLCRIDSAEENDAVISALREAQFYGTVYLGGMRDADSQDYHWIDEDKQMLDEVLNGDEYQSFWLRGEPSRTDGAGREERYMAILYRKESGWVWNDVCENIVALSPGYYSGKVAYICEYN